MSMFVSRERDKDTDKDTDTHMDIWTRTGNMDKTSKITKGMQWQNVEGTM